MTREEALLILSEGTATSDMEAALQQVAAELVFARKAVPVANGARNAGVAAVLSRSVLGLGHCDISFIGDSNFNQNSSTNGATPGSGWITGLHRELHEVLGAPVYATPLISARHNGGSGISFDVSGRILSLASDGTPIFSASGGNAALDSRFLSAGLHGYGYTASYPTGTQWNGVSWLPSWYGGVGETWTAGLNLLTIKGGASGSLNFQWRQNASPYTSFTTLAHNSQDSSGTSAGDSMKFVEKDVAIPAGLTDPAQLIIQSAGSSGLHGISYLSHYRKSLSGGVSISPMLTRGGWGLVTGAAGSRTEGLWTEIMAVPLHQIAAYYDALLQRQVACGQGSPRVINWIATGMNDRAYTNAATYKRALYAMIRRLEQAFAVVGDPSQMLYHVIANTHRVSDDGSNGQTNIDAYAQAGIEVATTIANCSAINYSGQFSAAQMQAGGFYQVINGTPDTAHLQITGNLALLDWAFKNVLL